MEICGLVCLIVLDDVFCKVGFIGKVFFYIDVCVVDEDGNDVLVDGDGEVIICGCYIMKEYWNCFEVIVDVICDGWFYLGDVVCIDVDGFIYI